MCRTPSKCIHEPWIFSFSPNYKEEELTKIHERLIIKEKKLKKGELKSGKWLIFVSRKNIDVVWNKIKEATEKGVLGIESKTATKLNPSRSNAHVICVYTYDWTDKKDVMRVREELRKLGVVNKIRYKTDEDTIKGRYSSMGDKNISKYYE